MSYPLIPHTVEVSLPAQYYSRLYDTTTRRFFDEIKEPQVDDIPTIQMMPLDIQQIVFQITTVGDTPYYRMRY